MNTADRFELNGYAVLRSLLEPHVVSFLNRYAMDYATCGTAATDAQVPGTPAIYGAPPMEKILRNIVPLVEQASGRLLYPTYSYFRVYKPGDRLAPHKDREACEISVSVCLGHKAAETWPLYVEGPAGRYGAMLEPGDGLLYKGIECLHWREPFNGESAAQVFLHYVDRNGPYADWKFDKRGETGTGKPERRSQHSPV